jgi:hypothetical protein
MKKISLTLLFGLNLLFAFGQNFETYITVSPNMTFGSNQSSANKKAFGFSCAIQEYYSISDVFAVGTEINYSYNSYKFIRDYDGFKIPESSIYYESLLSIQTLNIPLILKYNNAKKWVLQAEFGLTYVLNSTSKVNYVYNDWYSNDEIRTVISAKSDDLRREFNSYGNLSIGKGFIIFNHESLIQIFYEYTFAKYDFQHEGKINEALYIYKIKPQQIGLKFGFRLL